MIRARKDPSYEFEYPPYKCIDELADFFTITISAILGLSEDHVDTVVQYSLDDATIEVACYVPVKSADKISVSTHYGRKNRNALIDICRQLQLKYQRRVLFVFFPDDEDSE
jgi:hypothetical protein